MKRKPDTMIAVLGLFLAGLIISGFSSLSVGADEEVNKNAKHALERSVSRY